MLNFKCLNWGSFCGQKGIYCDVPLEDVFRQYRLPRSVQVKIALKKNEFYIYKFYYEIIKKALRLFGERLNCFFWWFDKFFTLGAPGQDHFSISSAFYAQIFHMNVLWAAFL